MVFWVFCSNETNENSFFDVFSNFFTSIINKYKTFPSPFKENTFEFDCLITTYKIFV